MKLQFAKMQGLGNDFVLIDDRKSAVSAFTSCEALAVKVCDRHFGIGADGILLLLDSDDHDAAFRIYNSDGSQAQMCGNGMRCMAKYLYEKKIIQKKTMRIETLAGTVVPKVIPDDGGTVTAVQVDMGVPILEPKKIPFDHDGKTAVSVPLKVKGTSYDITCVSMGNPHAVIFLDNFDSFDIHALGPAIENHFRFPEKTNVEFVKVISDTHLEMRVWERGAGITLACGTGACAALVAAALTKRAQKKARVSLAGGDLEIHWNSETGHVFKTGPAAMVFEGTIQI